MHAQDISYSEFRTLVKDQMVNDLVISSKYIRGKMKVGGRGNYPKSGRLK